MRPPKRARQQVCLSALIVCSRLEFYFSYPAALDKLHFFPLPAEKAGRFKRAAAAASMGAQDALLRASQQLGAVYTQQRCSWLSAASSPSRKNQQASGERLIFLQSPASHAAAIRSWRSFRQALKRFYLNRAILRRAKAYKSAHSAILRRAPTLSKSKSSLKSPSRKGCCCCGLLLLLLSLLFAVAGSAATLTHAFSSSSSS